MRIDSLSIKEFKTSEIKMICEGTLRHPNVESVTTTIVVKLKEPVSEFSSDREEIVKSIREEIIIPVQSNHLIDVIQSNNSGE